MFFHWWPNRVGAAAFMQALNYGYVLYSQASSVPPSLCILEHEGLTVQSSHSSPFMLTLTVLPCPLALIHWQCFIIKSTLVLKTYIKHFIFIFLLLPPPFLFLSPFSSSTDIMPLHCCEASNLADDETLGHMLSQH